MEPADRPVESTEPADRPVGRTEPANRPVVVWNLLMNLEKYGTCEWARSVKPVNGPVGV